MASGMTKTQLVRHLAEKMGTNNKTATMFLDHLAEAALKETKRSGVFVIPGLGRLVKQNRKARIGRNPQTGEAIKIPAKTVCKFRVAKTAKDAIAPPGRVLMQRTPPDDRIIVKMRRNITPPGDRTIVKKK